ncbi:hypothetical protein BC332_31171 [Capsicum chinense]|nr:hypothetical protein BC332_31171 [Capsicum chinense]
MANFEENVMVALYWGGEIIFEMSGFRYNEGARIIVSMSISTSYVELVEMLHEKMRSSSETIQMDNSGNYPCSFQEDEDNFDLCNDAHAQICDESSEEDELSEDDGESEILKSESDEDTNDSEDLPQNDIGVTYRKAWLGRQRAFKLVYGDFQKSFSDLPKFFATFQHFNHGTVVEWKHEESMSSLEEPQAFHRFCVRHLKSNFQSYFSNRNLSDLMWNAASAYQVRKFETLMWEIREENEETYEYLMQFLLDKWTTSHDDGKRWGVLTTNLSESFNSLLKKARGLPVTVMVRLTLEKIVERYTRKSQTAYQLVEQEELWTSSFKVKWEKNYDSSKRHFVFYWNISTGVYDVRSIQVYGTGGNPHRVSLNDKNCDCGKWANLHFPCSHVMKITERMRGLARNFVSEHSTTENYVATYSGSFLPVGYEAYWPSPSFIMRSNEFYRLPNRQRTTRVPNEMDREPAIYRRACGLCKQTGHDRHRCPIRNQT